MMSDGEKFACESCIRGHRVAQCQHTDRPLQRVGRKGRPATQCSHCRSLRTSRSVHTKCQCGSTAHQAMLRQLGRDRCLCSEGDPCICAFKGDADGITRRKPRSRRSAASLAPSPTPFQVDTLAADPGPLQPSPSSSSGTAHPVAEQRSLHTPQPSTDLDNPPSDALAAPWALSVADFPDFPSLDSQDWMVDLHAFTGVEASHYASITMPTLDELSSTVDSFGLENLLAELTGGEVPVDTDQHTTSNHWDLLDFSATNHEESEQFTRQS